MSEKAQMSPPDDASATTFYERSGPRLEPADSNAGDQTCEERLSRAHWDHLAETGPWLEQFAFACLAAHNVAGGIPHD